MAKGNWHTEVKAENKLKLEEKKNHKIGTYMVPGVSKFTYVFFFHLYNIIKVIFQWGNWGSVSLSKTPDTAIKW